MLCLSSALVGRRFEFLFARAEFSQWHAFVMYDFDTIRAQWLQMAVSESIVVSVLDERYLNEC